MKKRLVFILASILLLTGCATREKTIQEGQEKEIGGEEKKVEFAPSEKRDLLVKANRYLAQRDYANALINIVRAEKTGGDDELNDEIGEFKNNLIEKLNARALYEKQLVEIGKGLNTPLKYMVFYMEGEVIYPAFNLPVSFEVKKGKAQITEKGFTNTSGVAECEVNTIESLDENELTITADVTLGLEGKTYSIAKLQREFTLQYKSIKEQTISFIVFEKNIDEIVLNSVSGRLIEDFFIENGFSVLQGINEHNRELFIRATSGDQDSLNEYKNILETSLIAFAHIESVFSSKVSEGFYFAKSNIILNVIDAETNRMIFNSVIKDIKGAGNTEEKAGRKAINEAMEEFLEKLKGEINDIELKR
ncbi:MAG: hypothetical protein AMS17_01985 [Spirochaetes bacterium DG_61]|nr:MAG: hypothetical protein AMS17_01985 [Spirochaetes bacterium DG_61]